MYSSYPSILRYYMSDSSRSFRLSNYFLLLTNATRAQLHRSKFLSLLREVKTCIALKNYSEARYSGPVICTFRFNNFYPIWSLFINPCFLHAYISLARRVIPTISRLFHILTSSPPLPFHAVSVQEPSPRLTVWFWVKHSSVYFLSKLMLRRMLVL